MVGERRPRGESGFTILELLIVVAVIGIIAAIAIPNLIAAIQRSRQSRTVADMRIIGLGAESYQKDYSLYPVIDNGTVADLSVHLQLYIPNHNKYDGWNQEFFYDSDGTHYTIVSTGADAVDSLPWPTGPTSTFDADIVYVDGNFIQWPEGQQTH